MQADPDNAKFDTVAAFNNRQHVGDFTLAVDARMTRANEGINSYMEILFRAEEENGNWRWAWLICYANSETFLGLDTLIGNVWRKIERIKLPFVLAIGEWHNIKLDVKETQIALWIDRKLVQQVDWRKHRADLPEAGEIQIGVAGGESQWDNFVFSGDEVPDFSDLSVVPKGKLTTYWASLKRP